MSTDFSPIQTRLSAHLFTCPYSTDATNNPPTDRPKTLNTISRPTLTLAGLTSCGYCLSSSVPFSNRVCRHAVQESNPVFHLFDSATSHHITTMPVLPTCLFTNTQYSRETRNSTTCPCQSNLVSITSVPVSWNSNPELKPLVLMFTSLPSPPGRLYELSLSSSAQLLDFLTRKVYILTLCPLHDNGLTIFPIGTPVTTLFLSLSSRVLPHSLTRSFFFL